MKRFQTGIQEYKIILFLGYIFLGTPSSLAQNPISLHSENPHYFTYKSKPTILISSAEHYGAVLNLDFDYKKYLSVLKQNGFNQTRIFSGVYCEGSEYDIEKGKKFDWSEVQNPLAPRPGKLLAPWARSNTPGYIRSGNKFDLDTWDEAYFRRLKDFISEANNHGVIVEVVLFTAFYSPNFWLNSPLNPINNVNDVEDIPYNEFHLPKHRKLFSRQLDMVKKIVTEVNAFDNVYFEICNEPYWLLGTKGDDSTVKEQQFLPELDTWQQEIVRVIIQTEKNLLKKHLIAQNIANTYHKVSTLDPSVSILNFHYAFPPQCVEDNFAFNKPIVFDETSDGVNAPNRRREAWAFMMSGGAGYSNLDWSFVTDDASGLGRNPSGRRRSGKEVREQLKVLADEMNRFDFVKSRPIPNGFFRNAGDGFSTFGLYVPSKEYMIYILKEKNVSIDRAELELPEGKYIARCIDPISGVILKTEMLKHNGGGVATISLPLFTDDLLLRINKQG